MIRRSLLLPFALFAPGCALIDAAGETTTDACGLGFTADNASNTGQSPASVAIADMDSDGFKDLVTLSSGNLVVAWGHGDGSFGPVDMVGAGGAQFLAIADLDDDGSLDVAGSGINTQAVAIRNLGGRAFELVTLSVPRASQMSRVAAGRAWMAVGTVADPTLAIWNQPFDLMPPLEVEHASGPQAMASGDLDGNGSDELVIASSGGISALVPPDFASRTLMPGTGGTIHKLATGNFLEQGPGLDVAFAEIQSSGPNAVGLLIMGDDLQVAGSRLFGQGRVAEQLAAADLDGDGEDDLGLLASMSHEVVLVFMDPGGLPGPSCDGGLEKDGGAFSFAAGDLNSDGRADFALAPGRQGGIDLLLSR